MLQSRQAAYAVSTQKGHQHHWNYFARFCVHFDLIMVPASAETLSLYAQFLSRTFKAVTSIANYISSVKLLHIMLAQPTEAFSAFEYKITLKGLTRNKKHMVRQALPITPQLLVTFQGMLNLQDPVDATYWCLFLFAFFAMARKSNLVPNSSKKFDPNKQLIRDRVLIGDDCLLLVWDWAKNIQAGERAHKVPLMAMHQSSLCPLKAYLHMCRLVPAGGKDPVFAVHKKQSLVPITYANFNSKLKQLVKRAGKDPQHYSTHSFRRGGATCAFQANVPDPLIQLQGDWASDCFRKYVKMGLAEKRLVSRAMGSMLKDTERQLCRC